jgi:hypothetical protein
LQPSTREPNLGDAVIQEDRALGLSASVERKEQNPHPLSCETTSIKWPLMPHLSSYNSAALLLFFPVTPTIRPEWKNQFLFVHLIRREFSLINGG